MLVALILLLLVGGIAQTQTISDPKTVTLRWLRLGGVIAVTLTAVALTMWLIASEQGGRLMPLALTILLVTLVAQLFATQLGKPTAQRMLAATAALQVVGYVCAMLILQPRPPVEVAPNTWVIWSVAVPSVTASAALLGGCLMTMLLGHAYLTAGGEMTQQPFARLVKLLILALALRAGLTMFAGFLPWYRHASAYGFAGSQLSWQAVMVSARLLVGIVVPSVFLYMVRDCVRRRANQSATGILYVLAVTLIIGEGIALTLLRSTGYAF